MPDAPPNPELLRSLGRLARGLSALFWGLPASLVICVETAKTDWLKPLGIIPALAAMGLLLYGLWQMSDFQKQERPWRNALDRAKLLGLVNLGLCPFLYWHNKMPQELFFMAAVFVLVLSAAIFLFNLNVVLKQLAAMLPEETLRHEMRLFTALNRWLIVGLLFLWHCVCGFDQHSTTATGTRHAFRLAQPDWFVDTDTFCLAAIGHDDGVDLENQGNHSRQRFRRKVKTSAKASSG